MKENKPMTIPINKPLVIDRVFARSLLSNSDNKRLVQVDFTAVEFASRSFIDELLQQIEKRILAVEFVNTNKSVSAMIKLVQHQRKNPEKYKAKWNQNFELTSLEKARI